MDLLRRLNQLPNTVKPDDAQNQLRSLTREYIREHLLADDKVLIKSDIGKYWRGLGEGVSWNRDEAHPYQAQDALRYTYCYQSTFERP